MIKTLALAAFIALAMAASHARADESVIAPYRVAGNQVYQGSRVIIHAGDSYLAGFMVRYMEEMVYLSDRVELVELNAFVDLGRQVLRAMEDTTRTLPECEIEVSFLMTQVQAILRRGGHSITMRNRMGQFDFSAVIERLNAKSYRQWTYEYVDLINAVRSRLTIEDFDRYFGPMVTDLNQFSSMVDSYGILHPQVYDSFNRIKASLAAAEPALRAIAQRDQQGFRDIENIRRKILSFRN